MNVGMHNLPGGRLLQSNCLLSALNEQGRISVEDEAMYNNNIILLVVKESCFCIVTIMYMMLTWK